MTPEFIKFYDNVSRYHAKGISEFHIDWFIYNKFYLRYYVHAANLAFLAS